MDDVFEVGAPAPAPEDDPFGMGAPAEVPSFEAPAEVPSFEAPADMGGFEAPAEVPSFEPPAEVPSFEAPAEVPSFGGDMGGMGGGMPPMGGMGDMGGNAFMDPTELSPLAKWRIAQQEKLAEKAAASDAALQTRLAEAQEALSTFYAERTDKTTKRAAENRTAEAAYVQERDAAMIADSWESVCKLVDLKGTEKPKEEKDTSRMRGLLVQLKHVV